MTQTSAGGSGRHGRRPTWPAILILVALVVTACGRAATSTASPTPAGSGGVATPEPKPTHWPGTAVLAVLALAQADGQIAKAGEDFATAANTSDVALMWGAADGLIPLIKQVMPNVDPLVGFDKTAELAGYLKKAFPMLLDGATLLRDSITAGDAAGVEKGSQELADGLNAYAPARAILSGLVEEALLQQRILNL